MSTSCRYWHSIRFVLCLAVISSFAVISPLLYASPPEISFDCLTLDHGLSQTTVVDIVQDSMGYMWFGTIDGLNQFDGNTFTVYRNNKADPRSISDDWLTSLLVDSQGRLWIGTLSGGLNQFIKSEETFIHYALGSDSSISDIHIDRLGLPFSHAFFNQNSITSLCEDTETGQIWVGTFGNGLYRFDPGVEEFTRFSYPSPRRNELVYCIMSLCSMNGSLWIGTFGGGLIRYTPDTGFTFYHHDPKNRDSLGSDFITCVQVSNTCPDHRLWIGTLGGGLDEFHTEDHHFSHHRHDPGNPNSLNDDHVLSVLIDCCQILWIGTVRGGLNRYDMKSGAFSHYEHDPKKPDGLSSNQVISLFEDESGIIWVGTVLGYGIHKFNKGMRKFEHYYQDPSNPNSLSENMIFSIYEDPSGMLWIGTHKEGLDQFDRKAKKVTNYRHDPKNPYSLSDNHVRAIYEDRFGTLWIGTFSGGLNRFDKVTKKIRRYLCDPSDSASISANQIRSITEDPNGTLWIGTFGGGLEKFNRKTERFEHFRNDPSDPHSLSDDRIYSICQDGNGAMWIATFEGGINRFDLETESFTRFQNDPFNPNSLTDNRIYTVYCDKFHRGIVWIGTSGGGLDRYDCQTHTFKHYTREDGLPNNVIYGIVSDDDGNLWLSTNKGISKFRADTQTFSNYDASDGLQSNEFNAGSYYKSRDGEIFFGGIHGFNGFNPERVQNNPFIPPIVITSFKIFDRDMPGAMTEDRKIRLSYTDNYISFEFSALDYTNMKKNQYAYKLIGLNDDWIKCGTRRYVNYTNLDPGNYTFCVKGTNSDGIWNERGTFVSLVIHPPFWRQGWFYFSSIFCIAMAALFFHRHRLKVNITRSLELERVRMAENERVRKNVAADFHDELGQKLTRISLFAEILKRKLNSASSYHFEYIEKINMVAKELAGSTRDFIWTLDPDQDTLYDVIIYLKDFGDDVFDKTEKIFRVDGISQELRDVRLPVEWRRSLILIFKEGMSNILKRAGCDNIIFNILLKGSFLQIELSDDGVGCDMAATSNKGSGMQNMIKRATAINGRLKIIRNEDKGMTLRFLGEIPQMGH